MTNLTPHKKTLTSRLRRFGAFGVPKRAKGPQKASASVKQRATAEYSPKIQAGYQVRTQFAPETLPCGEHAPRVGAKGCQAKGSAKQVHGSFTACGANRAIGPNKKSPTLSKEQRHEMVGVEHVLPSCLLCSTDTIFKVSPNGVGLNSIGRPAD